MHVSNSSSSDPNAAATVHPTPHRHSRAVKTRSCAPLLGTLLLATTLAQPAAAKLVGLDAALDTPVILAGEPQKAYVRVALKGAELERSRRSTALNLAIVLDRSGSMSGQKIVEARQAAIMAIERLGPDDIISVVTYDDTVRVLWPASRLADAPDLAAKIASIETGNSTALFAGVSKGAAEVRKFFSKSRVNRVILLSDGIANVGPSSPSELAELGATLAREGMAVSTIGLGLDYNEDLMTRLASASDGNHFFAERAEDLASVYDAELGEVLSVIAQDVEVTLRLADGIQPVRVLGREAEIRGRNVVGRLNQLYARQTKYFVVEVTVPAGVAGTARPIGEVTVGYHDLTSGQPETLTEALTCRFSTRLAEVNAARNPRVVGAVARQLGAETNQTAIALRDAGKIAEAKAMLLSNSVYLAEAAALTDNKHLAKDAAESKDAAENLDEASWKRQRKVMSKQQIDKLQALGYVE